MLPRLLPNSLVMVLVFSVRCYYFICFLGGGEGGVGCCLFFFSAGETSEDDRVSSVSLA